jgi:hypothetical protein
VALTMPDELTVAHPWKEERKPREYSFDGVFAPDAGQDEVWGRLKGLGGLGYVPRKQTRTAAWAHSPAELPSALLPAAAPATFRPHTIADTSRKTSTPLRPQHAPGVCRHTPPGAVGCGRLQRVHLRVRPDGQRQDAHHLRLKGAAGAHAQVRASNRAPRAGASTSTLGHRGGGPCCLVLCSGALPLGTIDNPMPPNTSASLTHPPPNTHVVSSKHPRNLRPLFPPCPRDPGV